MELEQVLSSRLLSACNVLSGDCMCTSELQRRACTCVVLYVVVLYTCLCCFRCLFHLRTFGLALKAGIMADVPTSHSHIFSFVWFLLHSVTTANNNDIIIYYNIINNNLDTSATNGNKEYYLSAKLES